MPAEAARRRAELMLMPSVAAKVRTCVLVVETGMDAVLFWGAYAAFIGVLGTLVGIAQTAQFRRRFVFDSD